MPYKNKNKKVKCPKCGYIWFTKQIGYICCSRCKRYFGKFMNKRMKGGTKR